MSYSFDKVTTIADCDALIELAQNKISEINFKQTSENRRHSKIGNSATTLPNDLESIGSKLALLQAAVVNMQEGEEKRNTEKEILQMQLRQLTLTERIEDYNSVALVEAENEMELCASQLTVMATYVTALEARKTEIQAATPAAA